MDSTTDNSFRTLWGIMKTAGTPDYVANGALVDASDAAALPNSVFADSVNRRFPLTDRANTWASAGYFAKTASAEGYSKGMKDAVCSRILRAADVYGIGADVRDMMDKIAESEKPAPMDKTAADDASNYCDPSHRGYPVFDKEGAALANDFFERNAYKYGHERRREIAKNIMKKCAEYGVQASEQVRMSAGDGFPNRDTLAENLLFRANELMQRGTYKMASELCKFAEEICECSDEDLDRNREGIFDALSGIDEMTGIDDCYNRKFCAPEELVFDITPSSMREMIEDAIPLGRETFSARALSMLPRALFESVMPHDRVMSMMEGGKISPKKLSVTIISMKSPESSHLLRNIKDYTNGLIDVEDDPETEEVEEAEEVPDKSEKDEKVEKVEKPEKSEKKEESEEKAEKSEKSDKSEKEDKED